MASVDAPRPPSPPLPELLENQLTQRAALAVQPAIRWGVLHLETDITHWAPSAEYSRLGCPHCPDICSECEPASQDPLGVGLHLETCTAGRAMGGVAVHYRWCWLVGVAQYTRWDHQQNQSYSERMNE